MKRVESANSVDPDEAAHNEPPHLDLCCLSCCPRIFNMIWLGIPGRIFIEILQA